MIVAFPFSLLLLRRRKDGRKRDEREKNDSVVKEALDEGLFLDKIKHTTKKVDKKKRTKSLCGALLPSRGKRVASSGPLSLSLSSTRRVVVIYSFFLSTTPPLILKSRKRGEHPLARGEESRISGADVCVARAVEQFRCAFFSRGRAKGEREREDAGIARCRRLIF